MRKVTNTIYLRFKAGQYNLTLEGKVLGEDWHTVEIRPYRKYKKPTPSGKFEKQIDVKKQTRDWIREIENKKLSLNIIWAEY